MSALVDEPPAECTEHETLIQLMTGFAFVIGPAANVATMEAGATCTCNGDGGTVETTQARHIDAQASRSGSISR